MRGWDDVGVSDIIRACLRVVTSANYSIILAPADGGANSTLRPENYFRRVGLDFLRQVQLFANLFDGRRLSLMSD